MMRHLAHVFGLKMKDRNEWDRKVEFYFLQGPSWARLKTKLAADKCHLQLEGHWTRYLRVPVGNALDAISTGSSW